MMCVVESGRDGVFDAGGAFDWLGGGAGLAPLLEQAHALAAAIRAPDVAATGATVAALLRILAATVATSARTP